MKVLTYAGSEFMTSDAVAAALLEYGAALAEGREAATVEIPVIEADGAESVALFLVGPASQIVSRNAETGIPEPDHAEVVGRLEELTRRLRPTATADRNPPSEDVDWSFES